MADVSKLAPKILQWEGTAFTDDPNDAGGATKDGVTFSTFQHYEDSKGISKVTVQELKNLTVEGLTDILKKLYWDTCKGDEINDQQVADVIVDWLWGSGDDAIKGVQLILGVEETGYFGPLTLAAVNNADAATLCNNIVEARLRFYELICQEHPNWQRYQEGWDNRANSYRYNQSA
jgi:lysozyme family protein